ncbi:lysylphosphatidylglycerol synthase transmembrane domain-containing protein [Texcoconibacillus texcoconensis]|uniref:Phosphatidylglycerol lysyltransferase n=1 Tax=Texcoconibacillus texcoconensis TaxID=1095777 RepID=A0A840QRM7_9BACI|nr:lysylphosphatidylglycerol synthase transmembrane domain-containing protein [Texcoconibacillus texcoconensis]MBB5173999.1 hypothetical protein [Texcoconibacillus texcoconensis]
MNKRIPLAIGVLLIVFTVIKTGWDEVMSTASQMSLTDGAVMLLFQLLTLFLSSFVWYLFIVNEHVHIKLYDVFRINLTGQFVESITPSVKVGGEGVKIYLLRKKTGLGYQDVSALTVANKLVSTLAFLLIISGTVIMSLIFLELPMIIYGVFACFVIILFTFYQLLKWAERYPVNNESSIIFGKKLPRRFPNVYQWIEKIIQFVTQFSAKTLHIMKYTQYRNLILSVSMFIWMAYPLKVYLVSVMLGFDMSISIILIATYMAYLVSMIPLSPGGLGSFEMTMAFILSVGGVTYGDALTIALMTRVFTFWIPLMISGVTVLQFIMNHDIKRREREIEYGMDV